MNFNFSLIANTLPCSLIPFVLINKSLNLFNSCTLHLDFVTILQIKMEN